MGSALGLAGVVKDLFEEEFGNNSKILHSFVLTYLSKAVRPKSARDSSKLVLATKFDQRLSNTIGTKIALQSVCS